jgi:LacI family transcriptional regulator
MGRPAVPETTNGDSPKYVQIAALLATRIRAGEWDEKVPTVREIATNYEVSSFTASRALHLLRDQGLVVTKDRSGCYVAPEIPAVETATARWGLVLRVSPGPWREASEAVVRVGFDRLPGASGSFERFALEPPPEATKAAVEQSVRSVVEAGVEGVFLLPSRVSDESRRIDEWFLAGCRKAGVPVVLLDRNLRGEDRALEYDLITSDHFDGGLRCTEHLLGQGRRKVACVVASPTSSHNDRLAGYLYALHKSGGVHVPVVLHVPEDLDARETYPWLVAELRRAGADGVICYQDYTAFGLILELFRGGVNVPRDIGVVGCDDVPLGNSFSLGVTTYAYPSEGIARAALRAMANRIAHPDDPPLKLVLSGRLIVRESSRLT